MLKSIRIVAFLLIACSGKLAVAQISEKKAAEKLRRIEMALRIMDGTYALASKGRMVIGGIEVPTEVTDLLDSMSYVDMSSDQRNEYDQLLKGFLRDMTRIKSSGAEGEELREMKEGTRETFLADTKQIFLPFQTNEMEMKIGVNFGIPLLILERNDYWELDLNDQQRDEIAKKALKIAVDLEKTMKDLKRKKLQELLESLPDGARKKFESKFDIKDYTANRLDDVPINVFIYQFRSVKRPKNK